MSKADVMAPQPWSAVWPQLARGGLTLIFGLTALLLLVLAVLMPGVVAALLLVVFAVFALLDGVLGVGLLLFARGARGDRLHLLVRTIVALGVAMAAFAGPVLTGRPWERLATLVSAWAVLNGLLDVAVGSGLTGGPRQRWQIVLGAASVALGVVLLTWPPGMIALTGWIVVFSAAYGVITVLEACRSVRFY
jgi:uncharacterized membrane protein HdeD (DUF308 family)